MVNGHQRGGQDDRDMSRPWRSIHSNYKGMDAIDNAECQIAPIDDNAVSEFRIYPEVLASIRALSSGEAGESSGGITCWMHRCLALDSDLELLCLQTCPRHGRIQSEPFII